MPPAGLHGDGVETKLYAPKAGVSKMKRSVFTPLQCKVGVQGIVCKLLRTRLILRVLGSMFPVPEALRAKLAFMVPVQWMYGRCGCANPSPPNIKTPHPLNIQYSPLW